MISLIFVIGVIVIAVALSLAVFSTRSCVVTEDTVAITLDRTGFVQRVLPAGRHLLRPFEQIALTIETKTKLSSGRVGAISTADGILVNIHWSGTYSIQPDLIRTDEARSQRLRNLPNAEKGINRNVDIHLRQLVGNYPVRALFNPPLRSRIERQLSQILIEKLKPLGLAFNSLNLQTIDLPPELAEALNKAKAIETLDGAIRHLDPATREIVRGAYRLDEILHWDQYLPVPSRLTMKQLEQEAKV